VDTLLFYIKKFVKEGSIVYTDCWKGYSGPSRNGYVHYNKSWCIFCESWCVGTY